jgi:hypothetical protein
VLGLSGNNLENINNVVSLTTEHAVCPFHLAGHMRKGKMHPFITEKAHLPALSSVVPGDSPACNFRNMQMDIHVRNLNP